MKTAKEIITQSGTPDQIIQELKKTSVQIRNWSELEKEYNPKKHPVMTDKDYRDIVRDSGIEKVTRITIGLQKLATKRMTQLMFGIPVKRTYDTEDNEKKKEAAAVIEAILKKNRINTINIERAKYLFAGCEVATLWFATESKNNDYGVESEIKIRCKNYSPMNGDELYALFDEYDDMIALSFAYSRKEGDTKTKYFDTYTAENHIRWVNDGLKWIEEVNEPNTIGKIPAIYLTRPEPIWEDCSNDVYEIEWTLSRNGNYIRKNSKPLFIIYADDEVNTGGEENGDSRSVFQYPEGSKAEYVTWIQSTESIKMQIENLYRAFFTELQIPDMSFDQMKASPMSGEARKMMFIDAQLKVTDESGIWIEMLDREINVIKEFVKKIMPQHTNEIDSLNVETEITAFNIADESENIKNIMTATGGRPIVSQIEGVKFLGWSNDPDATMLQLQKESMSDLFEPTE